MTRELKLTGPCGGTLLGFLTVLGAGTLLAREGHNVAMRWEWEGGQWYGWLRGEVPASLTELAIWLQEKLTPTLESHPLWFTCLPDHERKARVEAYPQEPSEQSPVCLTGIGSLLATTEAWTPWYQLARRDHWEGILRRTLAKTKTSHLERALAGPWDFGDSVAGFGFRLSPTENRRYARQWHAPSSDPERTRKGAMMGANRLALETCVWWDALEENGTVAQTGWRRGPGGAKWTWALWREWLPYTVWRTVFSMVSLQVPTVTDDLRRDWEAMGLIAVCRVRRVLHEQTLLFLPPEYVYLAAGV